MSIKAVFPFIGTLQQYSATKLTQDFIAGLIVSIMVIPQSLAYAMLAGLPPEHGLYASIVPTLVYALLGTSSTMAVGPVAIASIMTTSALSNVENLGISYIDGSILLSLMSGFFLFFLGLFRFGFISHFLSHPVVTAFVTASGFIIALSQIKHLFGVELDSNQFFSIGYQLYHSIDQINPKTLLLGLSCLAFLIMSKTLVVPALKKIGVRDSIAKSVARIAPVLGVVATSFIVYRWHLDTEGVAIVGTIPQGIGEFGIPKWSFEAIKALALPAIFISIIGYIASISVSRTLASKRLEKVAPDQELIALGGSNIAAGLVSAFPISGGFTRSVINYDAGATTAISGIFTAVNIALISLFLTSYFYYLPIVMLAATIIVSASSLIDFSILKKTWKFSKKDFYAALLTILFTLSFGVEAGVGTGIVVSILLHLYHTSRPYVAELGLIPNTRHFRNILHFNVETQPSVVCLRFDESFIFSNVNFIEEYIEQLIDKRPEVKHIIIHCGAVNTIDYSGMELLFKINTTLQNANVQFHLSDLKTPLQKQLTQTDFFEEQYGRLYLNLYDGYTALTHKKSYS
ncbi:MAG: sulfate permease [Pseudomonadota bacterium]|nr:sulfate permease [Pseudomonadota bacterium]